MLFSVSIVHIVYMVSYRIVLHCIFMCVTSDRTVSTNIVNLCDCLEFVLKAT